MIDVGFAQRVKELTCAAPLHLNGRKTHMQAADFTRLPGE
jgi:hypothetical protein